MFTLQVSSRCLWLTAALSQSATNNIRVISRLLQYRLALRMSPMTFVLTNIKSYYTHTHTRIYRERERERERASCLCNLCFHLVCIRVIIIICSPNGDTDFFDIVAGVWQGHTLEPYMFTFHLDCILKVTIDLIKENGFTLRSRQYPIKTITQTTQMI